MALNIEGATIGYDVNNVQQALNNLNVNCIEKTIEQMKSSYHDLETAVDDAWHGASANTFKQNIWTDIDTISKTLKSTYDILESELYQIMNVMAEADSELVQERSSN